MSQSVSILKSIKSTSIQMNKTERIEYLLDFILFGINN
jgi:hypothetical protein